jgi:predicted ester cyclase
MLKRVLLALPLVLAILAVAVATFARPAFAGELEEKNKAVARTALEEMLGRGRIEENEAIYSPDYVSHGSRDIGRADDREMTKGWRQAFPDLRVQIDKILAEGDLVSVRFIAEGTNTASGLGLPVTGKSIRITGTTILRIVNGKIVEEWPSFDQLDLLRQLGLMPTQSK